MLKAERIVPIPTEDYPTRAQRPRNSRFNQTRLREVFDITCPSWIDALAAELDELAREGIEGRAL